MAKPQATPEADPPSFAKVAIIGYIYTGGQAVVGGWPGIPIDARAAACQY